MDGGSGDSNSTRGSQISLTVSIESTALRIMNTCTDLRTFEWEICKFIFENLRYKNLENAYDTIYHYTVTN